MPKVTKDKEAMLKRGNILYELRKNKNVKQSTVADILGISQQAYLKYEHGDADPTIDALIKLSEFYHVSIEYLLGIDTETLKPIQITQTDEELETALLEAYRAMPEDARKDFLNHIREAVLAEQNSGLYVERNLGELEDERRRTEEEREKGGKFA